MTESLWLKLNYRTNQVGWKRTDTWLNWGILFGFFLPTHAQELYWLNVNSSDFLAKHVKSKHMKANWQSLLVLKTVVTSCSFKFWGWVEVVFFGEREGGCIKEKEGLSLESGQSYLAVAAHERQLVGGFEAPLPTWQLGFWWDSMLFSQMTKSGCRRDSLLGDECLSSSSSNFQNSPQITIHY